jgi:simple sugar transport system permease protein
VTTATPAPRSPAVPQGRADGRSWKSRLRRAAIRPELASLAGVVAAFVIFSLATPLFLSTATFVPATSLAAQFGMVAVGVTLLMIGGQFDLSVGAIVGLTSWSMYFFGEQLALPPELAMVLALGFGTVLGLTNGVLVVRTGLASFIVTLATAMVYRGLLTMQTAGMPIVVEFPEQLTELLSGTGLAGYRMSVLWFLLLAVIATFFLLRTTIGNWVFSIGQNAQAARNLGVPVGRTTILLFSISGFTSALAGVIMASQYSSVDAGRGIEWELYAIAITVIGGTLLTGGYGSVIGTVLGALFYAIVQGGLILVGVQGYWVNILFGVVLILSVLLNRVIVQVMMTSPEQLEDETADSDESSASRVPTHGTPS